MKQQYKLPEWAWEIYLDSECPSFSNILKERGKLEFYEEMISQIVAIHLGWA